MNLGPTELLIVLAILLLLFGGAKLPKLARSLGQAQQEFRRGSDDQSGPNHGADRPADRALAERAAADRPTTERNGIAEPVSDDREHPAR